jgi:hypothetical protein
MILMTLSISTLAAIQKVGAAAFSADTKLKAAARDYAERVSAAITVDPDKKGNDSLIENWKIVARLSHTLEGIEEELKKVYQVASQLVADDQPSQREVAAPATPTRATSKSGDDTPAPLRVKAKTKAVLPKVKVSKVKASKVKVGDGAAKPLANGSNPAKLLSRLEGVLNANEFTGISQTLVAKETGIPLGSMTAAIKKLVETGWLVTGPNGSLKLVTAQPAAAPTSELLSNA